jgi:hypothetical protein
MSQYRQKAGVVALRSIDPFAKFQVKIDAGKKFGQILIGSLV